METILYLKIQEEKTPKQIIKDFFKVAEVVQHTVQKEEKKDKQTSLWKNH